MIWAAWLLVWLAPLIIAGIFVVGLQRDGGLGRR